MRGRSKRGCAYRFRAHAGVDAGRKRSRSKYFKNVINNPFRTFFGSVFPVVGWGFFATCISHAAGMCGKRDVHTAACRNNTGANLMQVSTHANVSGVANRNDHGNRIMQNW